MLGLYSYILLFFDWNVMKSTQTEHPSRNNVLMMTTFLKGIDRNLWKAKKMAEFNVEERRDRHVMENGKGGEK